MDVSKFLAKVLGIYLVLVSTAMLLNMAQFSDMVKHLINDAPLMFVTGFFTLIVGLLAVVSHNIWQWNWRLIITIIAWLSLIKGVSLIFVPQFLDSVSLMFVENVKLAYGAGILDFILGLILIYFGFRK